MFVSSFETFFFWVIQILSKIFPYPKRMLIWGWSNTRRPSKMTFIFLRPRLDNRITDDPRKNRPAKSTSSWLQKGCYFIWFGVLIWKLAFQKTQKTCSKSWDIQHPIHVKVTNWVSFCSLNSVWGTVVDGSPAKQLSLIAYLPKV